MDNLPLEIIEKIYKILIDLHSLPDDLKREIENEKLQKMFRYVQGIVGFRNASWGVVYHILTNNRGPVCYRYVSYEQKVLDLWNELSHEQRDDINIEFYIEHSYFNDDGLFYLE